MEVLLILALVYIMVTQTIKAYGDYQVLKELKRQSNQAEKLNYLMLRGTRARESRIKNIVSTTSTPLTEQPNEKRHRG